MASGELTRTTVRLYVYENEIEIIIGCGIWLQNAHRKYDTNETPDTTTELPTAVKNALQIQVAQGLTTKATISCTQY